MCGFNNVVIFVARFLLVDQYLEQISIIKIMLFFLYRTRSIVSI